MRKIQYAGYYKKFFELQRKTVDWIPGDNPIEPQSGDIVVNCFMGLGWDDMIVELNNRNLGLESYKNNCIVI